MNKLFIFKKIALTTFLPTLSLLMSCAKSPETKAIAANQTNENDKISMITPAVNNEGKDESPPVDLSKIPTVTYCDLIKKRR